MLSPQKHAQITLVTQSSLKVGVMGRGESKYLRVTLYVILGCAHGWIYYIHNDSELVNTSATEKYE